MIPYGTIVVYTTPKKRRYIKKLEEGIDWHSTNGSLRAADVSKINFGDIVHTSLGMPVRVQKATLCDVIMGIKRKTQIIYPKDIAQICMRLGVAPGKTIIEAGTGSGGLTLAFSWFCGDSGHVISHDEREEFSRLARRNLEWAGLGSNVELVTRNIAEGFCASGADALFLDMRDPWNYLEHIPKALSLGGVAGFLLPTAPQVSELLLGLEKGPFGDIEIEEILVRPWKPLPDRLRPFDRMTAHTGFLVFCKMHESSAEFDSYLAPGTRERKQQEALKARSGND